MNKFIRHTYDVEHRISNALSDPPEKLLDDAKQVIIELRTENSRFADLLFQVFNSDQFERLPNNLKQHITNEVNSRL